MWVLLSGIALSLTSARLLLTGKEPSLADQSQMLYIITSLTIGLGLLVAGSIASGSLAGERMARGRNQIVPPKRAPRLFGRACSIVAAWLLIFLISIPYVLLVGSGTSHSWMALTYTFVLGSLCVAGIATLIVGIAALARCGPVQALAWSLGVLVAMITPILLGHALQESWPGIVYGTFSPYAHATLSLEGLIVGKESLFVQLPHLGALAAFAAIAWVFAACGVSLMKDWQHGTRTGHGAPT